MKLNIKLLSGVVMVVLAMSHVKAADPVSYWTFDGDYNDSVGGNNGTAPNGATISSSTVIGAGALSLNGTNQYVDVGNNNSLNLTNSFTITMWVYNLNLNGAQINTGYYTRGGSGSGASLMAHGQRAVPSGATLWSNYGVDWPELKNGQWYQIALTFNGSTAAYYVDGKQATSFSASAPPSSTHATWLGAEGYGSGRWYLQGEIDDVGVYTNELDAASMALINGLGRTGGIGLDQLSAAQALWAGTNGQTAVIGGSTWHKATRLGGSPGDWSGSVAATNAMIVLDSSGGGIAMANAVAIPQPLPVSYWTFDSNMNDSVGGNNGTAAGGATIGSTSMVGGGALSLNGTSAYVDVGNNSSLNITGPMTITMWVYNNAVDSARTFYSRGEWVAGRALFISSAKLTSNNNGMGVQDGTLSAGTWYQLTETYDGTTCKLYVNGKQAAQGSAPCVSSTHATYIGAEGGGVPARWFMSGLMDDVGVYTNALNAVSVALVNGLGRTGGIGLDQLSAAQTLWLSPVGSFAQINGKWWRRVTGLSGSLGDWSGSVAGENAQIVLDNSGGGIKQETPPPLGTMITIE